MSVLIVTSAVLLALTGCATEDKSTTPPATQNNSTAEDETQHGEQEVEGGATETSIPSGARAASVDFPFPVPEGWEELGPFAEVTVGKTQAMSAGYEYPGDAESAASTYRSLLASAGYEVYDDPLNEVSHDAAFTVEGNIAGEMYGGGILFDTHADGSQKAVIFLTKSTS